MSLDDKIKLMKEELNLAVTTENICSDKIVGLSQKLDILIVRRMRRNLA